MNFEVGEGQCSVNTLVFEINVVSERGFGKKNLFFKKFALNGLSILNAGYIQQNFCTILAPIVLMLQIS